MKNQIFLFDSVKAAQEVAYSLMGNWDHCNSVNLANQDIEALKLAVALCDAKYCEVGDVCQIQEPDDSFCIDLEEKKLR